VLMLMLTLMLMLICVARLRSVTDVIPQVRRQTALIVVNRAVDLRIVCGDVRLPCRVRCMHLDGRSTVCCGAAKDVWVAHYEISGMCAHHTVIWRSNRTLCSLLVDSSMYVMLEEVSKCVYLPVSPQAVRADQRWLSRPQATQYDRVRVLMDSGMASKILRPV
jgi:hypothetical protein